MEKLFLDYPFYPFSSEALVTDQAITILKDVLSYGNVLSQLYFHCQTFFFTVNMAALEGLLTAPLCTSYFYCNTVHLRLTTFNILHLGQIVQN